MIDSVDDTGRERRGAAFCYPVELAHCFLADLLKKGVDHIFLPNVTGMCVENGIDMSVTCLLVQGEPYYLRSVFPEIKEQSILSPILDFSKGYNKMSKEFTAIGNKLGFRRSACVKAYKIAVEQQLACQREMKLIGQKLLEQLSNEPNSCGLVLFGRPYNALTQDVNIGIPGKFASRGQVIIPWDFLPYEQEEPYSRMFWSMGQMMLKAARLVEKNLKLFAAYVTNFSCGPDSFLLSYFRDIMGQKPSLTLELDSHTADAGVDTRIEAFLDVVAGYIELLKQAVKQPEPELWQGLSIQSQQGKVSIVDAGGNKYDLQDENVIVRISSMGANNTRLLAAAMRYVEVNATHMEPPKEKELIIGRSNSTCKECLPFLL